MRQLSSLKVSKFVIRLHGHIMMPDGSPGIRNIGLPLDDVVPVITFHGRYQLEDREVHFYIREATRGLGNFINCLDFTYETIYSSEDVSDLSSLDLWQGIVALWETWFENCNDLVFDFYHTHITE